MVTPTFTDYDSDLTGLFVNPFSTALGAKIVSWPISGLHAVRDVKSQSTNASNTNLPRPSFNSTPNNLQTQGNQPNKKTN